MANASTVGFGLRTTANTVVSGTAEGFFERYTARLGNKMLKAFRNADEVGKKLKSLGWAEYDVNEKGEYRVNTDNLRLWALDGHKVAEKLLE